MRTVLQETSGMAHFSTPHERYDQNCQRGEKDDGPVLPANDDQHENFSTYHEPCHGTSTNESSCAIYLRLLILMLSVSRPDADVCISTHTMVITTRFGCPINDGSIPC